MFDLKDRLKDFDVILASASPRRKELFSFICDDYKIIPAFKDEVVDNSLEVTEIPKVLAYNKCREIAEQNPDSLVVGCDTVVTYNNEVMGKPKDKSDAFEMLKKLSDKTHEVISGTCIYFKGEYISFSTVTKVTFKELSDNDIKAYIATGESDDKAGAYGIQGLGCMLVKGIEGDYFNVVGLAVSELADLLDKVID